MHTKITRIFLAIIVALVLIPTACFVLFGARSIPVSLSQRSRVIESPSISLSVIEKKDQSLTPIIWTGARQFNPGWLYDVIVETLQKTGLEVNPGIVALIYRTPAQESLNGLITIQHTWKDSVDGSGRPLEKGAKGVFQIETKNVLRDAEKHSSLYKTQHVYALKLVWRKDKPEEWNLRYNLRAQIILADLHYRRFIAAKRMTVPHPNDLRAQALVYKACWNTSAGAARVQDFIPRCIAHGVDKIT